MSSEQQEPIATWAALSERAARASAARGMARARIERPRRPAAAKAGIGLLTIAVVVVGAALVLRPGIAPAASQGPSDGAPKNGNPSPATSPSPIHLKTADGALRSDLGNPSGRYTTADAIEPLATLTYIGPDPSANVFHAASPVGFRIDEVGGNRVMDGGMDQPCLSTVVGQGAGKPYPFEKAGSPTDDPAAGFDRAWYQERTLRLPAGQWRIMAQLDVYLGGCGGNAERHQLTLSAEVTVVPFDPSNEPVSASKADDTLRLTLTTPRGVYGPNDGIQPVASVFYLGPQAETTIYTGDPVVLFTVEELGGGRRMDPFQNLPCNRTKVDQAEPLAFPFRKVGGIGTSFDPAWYQDPVLRLPVGTWRIQARLDADTTDGTTTCGGIHHEFTVENIIEVVADGAPTAPATTPTEPSPSEHPNAGDPNFSLRLDLPKATYATDEAIEPVATLTYLGPDELISYGHSDPAVFFTIEQVDGDAQMTGGAADSCTVTQLARGHSVQVPFDKSGQIGLGFDQAWFRDLVLRLPPGVWRIAVREGGIPACEAGGVIHRLAATREITVN
jgi:hypothetical protein